MQAEYAAQFDREMGCTEAEWRRWLPGAVGAHSVQVLGPGATVPIGTGSLALRWRVLPERQIALMRMPRLAVSFSFNGVPQTERHAFMRYFDLYTQRGGG